MQHITMQQVAPYSSGRESPQWGLNSASWEKGKGGGCEIRESSALSILFSASLSLFFHLRVNRQRTARWFYCTPSEAPQNPAEVWRPGRKIKRGMKNSKSGWVHEKGREWTGEAGRQESRAFLFPSAGLQAGSRGMGYGSLHPAFSYHCHSPWSHTQTQLAGQFNSLSPSHTHTHVPFSLPQMLGLRTPHINMP